MQPPVSPKSIEDSVALIDHLQAVLGKQLAQDISKTYFGDIGTYLPEDFKGPRNSERAILVFQSNDDRLEEGTRTQASEYRILSLTIVGMVNITTEFKAKPAEAYGERRLSIVMSKIRKFLTQNENTTLGGRVEHFSVGDLSWATFPRDRLMLRGAGLDVTARVRVPRL